jgi:hypothetical protein
MPGQHRKGGFLEVFFKGYFITEHPVVYIFYIALRQIFKNKITDLFDDFSMVRVKTTDVVVDIFLVTVCHSYFSFSGKLSGFL